MKADPQTPQRLHQLWCDLRGVPLPASPFHLMGWEDWLRHMLIEVPRTGIEVTPEDLLRTVILRRIRMYKEKPAILSAMLKISRVQRADECLEEFLEDRAERRPRPAYPAAKAEVLRATGRPDSPDLPAPRMARDVILSNLDKLRDAAGMKPKPEDQPTEQP